MIDIVGTTRGQGFCLDSQLLSIVNIKRLGYSLEYSQAFSTLFFRFYSERSLERPCHPTVSKILPTHAVVSTTVRQHKPLAIFVPQATCFLTFDRQSLHPCLVNKPSNTVFFLHCCQPIRFHAIYSLYFALLCHCVMTQSFDIFLPGHSKEHGRFVYFLINAHYHSRVFSSCEHARAEWIHYLSETSAYPDELCLQDTKTEI